MQHPVTVFQPTTAICPIDSNLGNVGNSLGITISTVRATKIIARIPRDVARDVQITSD
jgi:hypothetical protein